MSAFEPLLLTTPSLTPALALEVIPHGLTFHRLILQVSGRTHDVLVGPEAPEGHLKMKYTNTIIGRFANRIPVGSHEIAEGVVFEAKANENPRVSLHGGPTGYDSVEWKLIDKPTLFSDTEVASVPSSGAQFFSYTSPSGDQGYPGTLLVEVLVALVSPVEQERKYDDAKGKEFELGSLVYVYRAKLVEGKVTPVNLTQHWGFNLTASLPSKELSVKEHTLLLKADRLVDRDADSLRVGISKVPTEHDHSKGKKIGDGYPDAGYDDYYVFADRDIKQPKTFAASSLSSADYLKEILKPGAVSTEDTVTELASDTSGIRLSFDTNQGGAMFYSNTLSKASGSARKKIHGGSGGFEAGDGYEPGTAAFLEFHDPLWEAGEIKQGKGLLKEGEVYNNYVKMSVRFREV
ncbi:hypothetical protein VNI00_017472 [Paramarasmius palmivorus]|uniref:Galactose mutarotase-like protein n=1 Tax=Paramarasmius palmivorus TaxID=297713 RepID=A0AAW0B624_9AGAR